MLRVNHDVVDGVYDRTTHAKVINGLQKNAARRGFATELFARMKIAAVTFEAFSVKALSAKVKYGVWIIPSSERCCDEIDRHHPETHSQQGTQQGNTQTRPPTSDKELRRNLTVISSSRDSFCDPAWSPNALFKQTGCGA